MSTVVNGVTVPFPTTKFFYVGVRDGQVNVYFQKFKVKGTPESFVLCATAPLGAKSVIDTAGEALTKLAENHNILVYGFSLILFP